MKSQELRQSFLAFFKEKGHVIRPSASLIPDDPSLLFTVAGMVPFKPMFLGQVKLEFTRAASCQKCIRTNDIDNVGRTRRHNTFFEMLGNFSFGDYFKEDAIAWAWEFLTSPKWMALPVDKLWVSVFEDDDEAEAIWLKHVKKERIVRMGAKDNFWAAGPTGPCGPCSEIYYDFGPASDPSVKEGDIENGGNRYTEIWNNVFMQFNRDEAQKLTPLPKKNIDTGMGFERMAAVKQGKINSFDTDLFQPIIGAAAELAKRTYGGDEKGDLSLKIIADHLRGSVFLIGDGVLPSNEGRGYVLRRILRRAVRHGRLLGIKQAFLPALYPSVEGIFGSTYPELRERKGAILEALKDEEERFGKALDTGTELLESLIKKAKGKVLDGAEVFKLYDTFGFPLELTQEMAAEQGFTVDEARFQEELQAQRTRARAARADGGHGDAPIYGQLATKHGATRFEGYAKTRLDGAKVLAILVEGAEVKELSKGQSAELLLDATPFYGESGGQVGDSGRLEAAGIRLRVEDTRRRAGGELYLQHVTVEEGSLTLGQALVAQVDEGRRADIARHHSATHVLHAALREVLGSHVEQAGSFVSPERLRLDFHHTKGLSADERRQVEDLVNRRIVGNSAGLVRELKIDEARAEGAMALFGEKYGETVRVVSFGSWSKELCGGTHVHASGEIGVFKIESESSVSSGVRRIEAVAGLQALAAWRQEQDFVQGLADKLKSSVAALPVRVGKLLEREKELEKKLEKAMQGGAGAGDLLGGAKTVQGVKLIAAEIDGADEVQLRTLGEQLKQKLGSGVVVLGSRTDEKAMLVVQVSADLAAKVSAGKLVGELAPLVGGRGGGKPDLAQAGGKEPGKLPEALAAAEAALAKLLG